MLTGFVLFYVGAVLVINGLWLLDRIDGREIVVINIVTALVSGAVVLHDAFGHQADAASIRNATLSLLFCTTYLWVAWNRISGADGRGLGWFSLFVAVTALPVSVLAFRDALGAGETWMAVNWLAWAGLWFLYFLLLALRMPVARKAGWVTLLVGVFTGWLPRFLMIQGAL